jgi:hypothetical protein
MHRLRLARDSFRAYRLSVAKIPAHLSLTPKPVPCQTLETATALIKAKALRMRSRRSLPVRYDQGSISLPNNSCIKTYIDRKKEIIPNFEISLGSCLLDKYASRYLIRKMGWGVSQ